VKYSFDQILSLMRQRRTADSVLIQGMIEVRDRFNGDVIVPLPDVSANVAANRPGPNFFQESLDGLARQANAMLPKIGCPVKNPGSPASEERSDKLQAALYHGWYESQLKLKLNRSFRHIGGYGTNAFIVSPNDAGDTATIEIRDPLTTYPELRAPDDIRAPSNCGFLFARSPQWIRAHYPEAPSWVWNQEWDTLWDIVEWVDEEDIVIGIMGPRYPPYGYQDQRPYGTNAVELRRWTNKAGICPVVVPRRVTLDRIMGQLTSMINYSDLYARMMALQLVATEKATFPDTVVLSRTDVPATLVGGKWKDGRTGAVNHVVGGTIEVIGKEPGPGTMPMLQLVDQHVRGTMGAASLFSGSNGGMRTGAGVDALGDFQINPLVAEAQEIMANALVEVNRVWVAVKKGYYGPKQFSGFIGLPGSNKEVTYTPDKDLYTDRSVVYYPFPGGNVNSIAVALTQLAATDLISRKAAQRTHPFISDPDEMEQEVTLQKINDATLAGFAQELATQGASEVGALVSKKVAEGKNLADAILEAKAEVATQQPVDASGMPQGPGAPGAGPPGAGGPGGQLPPGLAQALAAQSAGPQAAPGGGIPTPPPDLMNFRHDLQGINEQVSAGAT
jgi:hypothetical protein